MAKWERDPVLMRRLAWLLAAAEVAAVTLNFYFVFSAYLRRVMVAVAPTLPSDRILYVVALVATGLCLVAVAVQGFLYVSGRAWARSAFLVENGAMILLGLVWFIHSMMGRGDTLAVRFGLLLPLVTLFPLIWPLMSLRPAAPGTRAG
jgi:hypothetical protein